MKRIVLFTLLILTVVGCSSSVSDKSIKDEEAETARRIREAGGTPPGESQEK